jgi:hypothetical protein
MFPPVTLAEAYTIVTAETADTFNSCNGGGQDPLSQEEQHFMVL